MSEFTIYHNPRCSKSRQTLALLEENNITPKVELYLENPPSVAELKVILNKLGVTAREILRKGEDAYKENSLSDTTLSEDAILELMHTHPKLIERPIVTHGKHAVVGRPPENVLTLLG